MTWREDAACLDVGPEPFFPPSGVSTAPAVRMCRSCPVREACLADALTYPHRDDYGIRGGTTRNERKLMRKEPA